MGTIILNFLIKLPEMKLNKKHIVSWVLFDFANSSYSAVIAAVVFPVYYVNSIVGNETGLGDIWWGRAISASMAVVALSSPFLGGIADYGGIRKRLLFIYTVVSVAAIASLSILKKGMFFEGFAIIALANLGMEGGLVFYNSFLPRIAPREFHGRVSAWGFAIGYSGSILSLLFALPLVMKGQFEATWFMVAAFFMLFSMPAFLFLPSDFRGEFSAVQAGIRGLRYTMKTIKEIWRRKEPRKFLISYLIYEDGVNTVIVFSSIFAATTLGFKSQELIALYLIVQVSALIVAFVMAKPIDTWGPKRVVIISLLMWTSVATIAFFIQTKVQFWLLASFAGLGVGTVQAATRAFFTQFVPGGKEAEYFGIYSLVGKSSAIAGPLIFGQVSKAFGSQRPAILSLVAFFLIGMIILKYVRGGGPNVKTE
jgi:UMF1 family MFS transporter